MLDNLAWLTSSLFRTSSYFCTTFPLYTTTEMCDEPIEIETERPINGATQ